ncbi:hypothetical protein QTP88_014942 [Uroleucon formosanum]
MTDDMNPKASRSGHFFDLHRWQSWTNISVQTLKRRVCDTALVMDSFPMHHIIIIYNTLSKVTFCFAQMCFVTAYGFGTLVLDPLSFIVDKKARCSACSPVCDRVNCESFMFVFAPQSVSSPLCY